MQLSPSQVIVLATPVFFLLIGLEYAWGVWRGRNTYRLNDAINSISLGMLSEASGALLVLFRIGIYTALATHVALLDAQAFWLSPVGWLAALVFYDFCYYWQHRTGHRVALFWAAHVVHHQSQDYNLSTALRQPSTYPFLNWVFYVPMALAGVPPLVFGVVALVDLLYQFWVHTEHVGKLGWFDRVFCSPSNHRVHHAVNDTYVDRNYGGILILWDRCFGTFREEDERCIYGTRAPLQSWDPLWSNAEVFWSLAQDSWHARSWGDKVRVWFKPPGWRPHDVAQRFPKAPFDIAQVRRYHPPVSDAVAWFAGLQFVALLGCVAYFLWHADQAPMSDSVVWLAALSAGMWAVGAVLQGRVTVPQVLLIEAAALAAATSATGLDGLHMVFKPLAMVLAIACVLQRGLGGRFEALLVAGLAFSLVGDVFLMLSGYFIPGLAAFLLAHVCYVLLFRQGMPWFPSGRALAATLAAGAAMYVFLLPGLDPVLKVAVAAYTVVIAMMAAQAIGRAVVLRDAGSLAVAVGAVFFMASDSLLAVNRFAVPLPMAQFAVLATYYVAQVLIALNAAVPRVHAGVGIAEPSLRASL
jgi:alkylglycerol monooxygenase